MTIYVVVTADTLETTPFRELLFDGLTVEQEPTAHANGEYAIIAGEDFREIDKLLNIYSANDLTAKWFDSLTLAHTSISLEET